MKYLLQTSFSDGTYQNPFKRGGVGIRYSAWRTKNSFTTFEEAKQAWADFKQDGLSRRRVSFSGKTLITPEGKVYRIGEQPTFSGGTESTLFFVEWMPGCSL